MSAAKMAAPHKVEYRAAARRQANVESRIADRRDLWEWDATRLKGVERLVAIQRLGAGESLALDDRGTLHRTFDGGKTWDGVPIDIPGAGDDAASYDVMSFHFVNPSVGWAAVNRTPADVLDREGFGSWLLRTTDGGSNWEVRYTDKTVQLTQMAFVNEQEGWVGGSRVVKDETQYSVPLVMHTTDQGNYWVDISDNLNSHDVDGPVRGIYAKEPSKAFLLDGSHKFLSTATGGQNWQADGKVTKLNMQTGLNQLGLRGDGRLWGLGSADSREGAWTTLAVQGGDNGWTLYWSYDVVLTDAAFLSDAEVIACGYIKTDDQPAFDGGSSDGVILHSSDAGRNWSVVYRDPRVREVNALAVVNRDDIWAVGDGGLVLRLKAKQKL